MIRHEPAIFTESKDVHVGIGASGTVLHVTAHIHHAGVGLLQQKRHEAEQKDLKHFEEFHNGLSG